MPPKKPSAASKKPSEPPPTANSKNDKSKSKSAPNAASAASAPAKGKGAANTSGSPAPSEPKQPTVQELIGGKSWTGKLPIALFYEHCVRSGWSKPEYDMRREGSKGFVASVTISQPNPKTKELQTVFFKPPADVNPHQPTAVEARHYCATYALHRVCNMKNVHMALPPTHRSYWAAFEELRKAAVKEGHAWKYEADPFTAKRERDAMFERAQKKRDAAVAVAEEGRPNPTVGQDPKAMKGWTKVPVVDMSLDRRKEVERLIHRYHQWNTAGVELTPKDRKKIVDEMVQMGFRQAHAEEATDWVKDKEEALEWLLIHVPEDDMPPQFLPENYASGFTFQSGDSALQLEYAAKRLSAGGYNIDICREALARNCGDEDRAAEGLMQMLLYGHQTSPAGPVEENLISFEEYTPEDGTDDWEQEQETLTAIYGEEKFTKVSSNVYRILLEPHPAGDGILPEKVFLEIRKPVKFDDSKKYPAVIPTLAIVPEGKTRMPAHVRLSIIRQTAEKAAEMLGEHMVFSLVDWLEGAICGIAERPGRLRDVSTAITGSDERDEQPTSKRGRGNKGRGAANPINWTPGTKRSMEILSQTLLRLKTPEQRQMMVKRQKLPAWKLREGIVQAVDASQVVIISGETGSGKSTQAVQFTLDDLIHKQLGEVVNIVCTQPRRISALGLADRVSAERCSAVGQEVGYAIRGESRQTRGMTKICFVTTGVLLRRLQTGDSLQDVSHIFVDEVHERSLDTDFLLLLLKRLLAKRNDLRVVLMSATLDAEVFANYFGGPSQVRLINIEGRTFPVIDFYLDSVIKRTGFDGGGRLAVRPKPADDADDMVDEGTEANIGSIVRSIGGRINYNLIAATVLHIDKALGNADGGILIFLPGTMEIQRCLDAIRTLPGGSTKYHALPLHASLMSSDQRRVFPPAPKGKRKVIAATNVAETSITIEDIVAVIDTGRVKETSYDALSNVVKLEEVWASRAAAKQRRGRAGRVREGTCYKLYTKTAEANRMPERPLPELLRVPLEQTCLSAKAMDVKDVPAFLASTLTPPDTAAVEGALTLLDRMGAVTDGELTALGRHMALIPADLKCSKLMILGALFGCLDATVVIASILTTRSPFFSPQDKRPEANAARARFAGTVINNNGDLLADYHAWRDWTALRSSTGVGEVRRWCEQHFLSHQTLLDITSNRRQYLDSLRDLGFLPIDLTPRDEAALNRNTDNETLVRALIAGAFTPQIAKIQLPEQKFSSSAAGALAVDPEARTIKYFTNNDSGRVFLHPSSTLFETQTFPGNSRFLAFFNKVATTKVFLRDCTPTNAYALLLLGGAVEVDPRGRGITVDGWIRLRGWGRIGILVRRLRAMVDAALGRMVDEPGALAAAAESDEVVACVVRLIEGNGT